MLSTKDTKQELSERVEAVTQQAYLEDLLRQSLGKENGHLEGLRTRIIQLDGTGAATVQITMKDGSSVFAKLYPNDSGQAIHDKLLTLREHGFGKGSRYQVVEPLGFTPEYRMMLAQGAKGHDVASTIGKDPEALLFGVRESAAWLAQLNNLPIRIGKPHSLLVSGELLSLSRRLVKVISKKPEHLSLALQMITTLEDLAPDTNEGLLVQTHGQFRPIHVFISDEAVTVIDLDRSRPCDPARDVAEYLHRMRMTMFWHSDSVDAADAPTEEFIKTYTANAPVSNLANLRFHWARYIFHSLNRKLKEGTARAIEEDETVAFYRSEFDQVLAGRFIP
jgi:hypothetical protein